MSGLFNDKTKVKIKSIRKGFLWAAVCIIIGEVVMGAILILSQSFDSMIGKIMGTFALCAAVMLVGVNNLIRMENENKVVSWMALAGLVAGIVGAFLAIMMIWEVMSVVWYDDAKCYYSYFCNSAYHLTVVAQVMLLLLNLAAAAFWISNVLVIKETMKAVKPLKITAVICEAYCFLYAIALIFGYDTVLTDSENWARWSGLSGLAGFAFVVTALTAWIISRVNKKEKVEQTDGAGNEMTQEMIREMVEKEVQERLKEEREKVKQGATPPLQADNMPPVVNRDSGVKVERTSVADQDNKMKAERALVTNRDGKMGVEEISAANRDEETKTESASISVESFESSNESHEQ